MCGKILFLRWTVFLRAFVVMTMNILKVLIIRLLTVPSVSVEPHAFDSIVFPHVIERNGLVRLGERGREESSFGRFCRLLDKTWLAPKRAYGKPQPFNVIFIPLVLKYCLDVLEFCHSVLWQYYYVVWLYYVVRFCHYVVWFCHFMWWGFGIMWRGLLVTCYVSIMMCCGLLLTCCVYNHIRGEPRCHKRIDLITYNVNTARQRKTSTRHITINLVT